MSTIYTLVKKDTAPQIKATLTREDDGTLIDFENGSCALKFRKKGTTAVLFTLAASVIETLYEILEFYLRDDF